MPIYNGDFPYEFKFFENVTDPKERAKVEDYELTIYICSGTNDEKLKWFETINIAGKQLNPQELLNATFPGPFLTDAKRDSVKIIARLIVSGESICLQVHQ